MKLNVKAFLGAFLLVSCAFSSIRAEQFEGFKANATDGKALRAFARDLGGLVGSSSFHSGRSLGFPGVDIGFHLSGQSKPEEDNVILKDLQGQPVKNLVLPMAHGGIGLPYNFDVVLRGVSHQDFALVGAGLRYGLFQAKFIPFAPALSVSAFTHVANHTSFSMTHVAGNVALDLAVPFINPYIGGGYDSSKIKIKEAVNAGVIGVSASGGGWRGVIGLNLKLLPLIYINGGYAYRHGQGGYEAGVGVKF